MKARVKRLYTTTKKFLSKRVDINLPLPKNKYGKWLKKDVKLVPKYVKDSFKELKKVTWPSRSESWKLFMAVMVFSLVLTLVIAIADYIFEKLLFETLLKG